MKFNPIKFALACATTITLVVLISHIFRHIRCMYGMMPLGRGLMTKCPMCNFGHCMTLHPALHHFFGLGFVFVLAFVSAYFFAWFYNTLIETK